MQQFRRGRWSLLRGFFLTPSIIYLPGSSEANTWTNLLHCRQSPPIFGPVVPCLIARQEPLSYKFVLIFLIHITPHQLLVSKFIAEVLKCLSVFVYCGLLQGVEQENLNSVQAKPTIHTDSDSMELVRFGPYSLEQKVWNMNGYQPSPTDL